MKKLLTLTLALALTIAFTPTASAKKQTDWIYIPKANISERVQWSGYDLDTQTICDKRDRAVAYPYRGGVGIADHNYQGFRNLPKVKVGYTMTLTLRGQTSRYRCVKVIPNGWNKSVYLTDQNFKIVELKKGQVHAYTCNGRGSSNRIYITIWQRIR